MDGDRRARGELQLSGQKVQAVLHSRFSIRVSKFSVIDSKVSPFNLFLNAKTERPRPFSEKLKNSSSGPFLSFD